MTKAGSKKRYYAYFVPDGARGVTDDWAKTEKMVKGRTGARYQAFHDKSEAERWLLHGAVYESRPSVRLEPGVYFDAGTGRGKGVEISVTNENGNNLLHQALSNKELNRFGKHLLDNVSATNNYGELLALRYALQIAKKSRAKRIFGDSKLVIDYWSKWRMKKKKLSEETVELAHEVAKMRAAFEKRGGIVARIPGGHNPADLGFHR